MRVTPSRERRSLHAPPLIDRKEPDGSKDRNPKKSMEKKPSQKTLKEKRQAKREKK